MQKINLKALINPIPVLIISIGMVFVLWVVWFSFGIYFIHDDISYHAAKLLKSQSSSSSTSVDTFFARLGQGGDAFGGFNAIISALACTGVFFAAYLQYKTLIETKSGLKDQEKTNQLQTHLNIFNNTMDIHQNITNTLVYTTTESYLIDEIRILAGLSISNSAADTSRTSVTGRSVFKIILSKISHNNETNPEEIISNYKHNIQERQNQILGHYFRNLYHALRVIDEIPQELISQKDKKTKYTNLLRAQLSSYELCILFLNCSRGVVDSGEFRNLLIKYEILEHIPLYQEKSYFKVKGMDIILANKHMKEYFIDEKGNSAYGRNRFSI